MKIKQDFVTNSSSTCYVCCLPNDKEWILENIKQTEEYEEAIEDGLGEEEFEGIIISLLAGKQVYEYDNCQIFNAIVNFIRNNEFEIAGFEVGSEQGAVLNINEENMIKMTNILTRKN